MPDIFSSVSLSEAPPAAAAAADEIEAEDEEDEEDEEAAAASFDLLRMYPATSETVTPENRSVESIANPMRC